MSDKTIEELRAENEQLRKTNGELLEQIGGISVECGIPMDGRVIMDALRQTDKVNDIGVISIDKARTITVEVRHDSEGGVSIALVGPGGNITFSEAMSSLLFGAVHVLNQRNIDMTAFAETARGFFRGVAVYIAKRPSVDQN